MHHFHFTSIGHLHHVEPNDRLDTYVAAFRTIQAIQCVGFCHSMLCAKEHIWSFDDFVLCNVSWSNGERDGYCMIRIVLHYDSCDDPVSVLGGSFLVFICEPVRMVISELWHLANVLLGYDS